MATPEIKDKPMKISGSKRLTLTYVVFTVWVALAIYALTISGDLYGLAVYFASGLPLILGYLWSETSRPSINVAEIVKNIGSKPQGGSSASPSFFGGSTYQPPTPTPTTPTQSTPANDAEPSIVSIYSDDASVELKVDQTQLTTLTNIGYVDMIANKYTFKKSLLDQIKSLISNNTPEPSI